MTNGTMGGGAVHVGVCAALGLAAAAVVVAEHVRRRRAAESLPGQSAAEAARMLQGRKAICVYLGSKPGAREEYMAAAAELGATLAKRDIALVYGGGDVGLMGQVARACDENGGTVVGIIPRPLTARERAGVGAQPDNMVVVESMHERKSVMAALSDAFVVMPGGFGTMEEMLEVITWTQLGVHNKTVGLLDVCGFWAPMRAMFDHAVKEGFIFESNLAITVTDADVAALLDKLLASKPPKGVLSWPSSSAAAQFT